MSWDIHHIGYLAEDLEAEAARWCDDFGYVRDGPAHDDPAQTARVIFLHLPGADHWLELITPLTLTSKLANALRQHCTWHHVAYEVANLPESVDFLRDRGWLPLDEPVPAVAFGGRRIAWLMDRRRTLIEIVQAGDGPYNLADLRSRRYP